MKSFADWTQELAESQNHEPDDGAEECEYCDGNGCHTSKTAHTTCRVCEGSGELHEVRCSGPYCENRGLPNYEGGLYYCGEGPPKSCCP